MNDKPTILHTEVSDGWGGQEIRILGEMLGMKGRGYDVLLAAPEHTKIYKRAVDAGIESFAVGMDKAGFVKGVIGLVRIIKDRRVSIINTHSSRDSWMGSIAGRAAGIKVLRSRHISSRLRTDLLTRLVYGPLCDAIITTGEYIKHQLTDGLGIRPDKVHPIATGIDVEKFASARGELLRAELGLDNSAIILGTAAALRGWKGHEFTVKAMPAVLEEFPGVRLVLAGEGPMRPYIESWVREYGLEDKVFFLGHREDVAEVIQSFDISMLTSWASEGIPQFALQSMAAGKPVVGTRVGGIPEVVIDGVNGFVVPSYDFGAVAEAVIKLLRDPARMKDMGEAGRKMAFERHTTDMMLDSIVGLYKTILT